MHNRRRWEAVHQGFPCSLNSWELLHCRYIRPHLESHRSAENGFPPYREQTGYRSYIKDFVRTHPDVIVQGSVPYSEIVERLKEQYGAVAIPLAEIPSMRMHRYNAINLPANEALRLAEEQLKFSAIKIPITDKSSLYTAKDYVSVVGMDGKEFIYLVYEDQLRYHYSNSNIKALFCPISIR